MTRWSSDIFRLFLATMVMQPAVLPEGLEVVRAEKPDLICLDLQMPGEWGPRFYRKLRKDKKLKDLPIIVVSGIDGDHAIKDAVAFVKKPFDPEKLVGIVKNTIG
jgi:CheY-like chemotaxis protein